MQNESFQMTKNRKFRTIQSTLFTMFNNESNRNVKEWSTHTPLTFDMNGKIQFPINNNNKNKNCCIFIRKILMKTFQQQLKPKCCVCVCLFLSLWVISIFRLFFSLSLDAYYSFLHSINFYTHVKLSLSVIRFSLSVGLFSLSTLPTWKVNKNKNKKIFIKQNFYTWATYYDYYDIFFRLFIRTWRIICVCVERTCIDVCRWVCVFSVLWNSPWFKCIWLQYEIHSRLFTKLKSIFSTLIFMYAKNSSEFSAIFHEFVDQNSHPFGVCFFGTFVDCVCVCT